MPLRMSQFQRWQREHGGTVNKALLESVGRDQFAALDRFVNASFRSPQGGEMTGGLDELWSLIDLARGRSGAASLRQLARKVLPDANSEQQVSESLAAVFQVADAARDGRLATVSRLMLAQDFIRREDSDVLRPLRGQAPSQVNDTLQTALEANEAPADDVPPPAGDERRLLEQAGRHGGLDGNALLPPANGDGRESAVAAAAVEAIITVNAGEGAIEPDAPDPIGASNGIYETIDSLLPPYNAVLPEELAEESSRESVYEQTGDMLGHASDMEVETGEPEDRPVTVAVEDMIVDLDSLSPEKTVRFLKESTLDEAAREQVQEARASRRSQENHDRDDHSSDEAPPTGTEDGAEREALKVAEA